MMPPAPRHEPDDGVLLARYVFDGDQQAFGEIVSRYAETVFGLCRRFSHSRHDAEDLTQQVFATLAQHAESLTERLSLEGWLRRTAWQISARFARSAQTRHRHELARAVQTAALDGSPSQPALEPDTVAILRQKLDVLPEEYRDAILLYYFEGKTVAEVARHTGSPMGTAAARISRAREMLRQCLSAELLGWINIITTLELIRIARTGTKTTIARGPSFGGAWPARGRRLTFVERRLGRFSGRFFMIAGSLGRLPFPARAAGIALTVALVGGSAAAAVVATGTLFAKTMAKVVDHADDGGGDSAPAQQAQSNTRQANPLATEESRGSPAFGAAGIPEPTALPMLGIAACTALARRRRSTKI